MIQPPSKQTLEGLYILKQVELCIDCKTLFPAGPDTLGGRDEAGCPACTNACCLPPAKPTWKL